MRAPTGGIAASRYPARNPIVTIFPEGIAKASEHAAKFPGCDSDNAGFANEHGVDGWRNGSPTPPPFRYHCLRNCGHVVWPPEGPRCRGQARGFLCHAQGKRQSRRLLFLSHDGFARHRHRGGGVGICAPPSMPIWAIPISPASACLKSGPASGFLTVTMEKKGRLRRLSGSDGGKGTWEFVPYPESFMKSNRADRRTGIPRLQNSFWLTRKLHGSSSKVYYGDANSIPDALGRFDIALLAAVLLHCQSPTRIIEQCAKRSNCIIIAERLFPELEGKPVCRLVPDVDNKAWDTWWDFSTEFFHSISSRSRFLLIFE